MSALAWMLVGVWIFLCVIFTVWGACTIFGLIGKVRSMKLSDYRRIERMALRNKPRQKKNLNERLGIGRIWDPSYESNHLRETTLAESKAIRSLIWKNYNKISPVKRNLVMVARGRR